MRHVPVLLKEVIEIFNPQPGQIYIDATVGEGGHAKEILKRISPGGVLVGLDWDPNVLEKLKSELLSPEGKVILLNTNYTAMEEMVEKQKLDNVDGILFDLGFGTHTLQDSGRGFSFQREEPLDMRYNPSATSITASDVLNRYSEKDLEKIFKEYGEERFSWRIARGVVTARGNRKIETTGQFVQIIKENVPARFLRQKLHPATRVFQALRIFVNQELSNLRITLPQALNILKPGGKIIVISFHSLEDRLVKIFFKEEKIKKELNIITPKPVTTSIEEIRGNPASSSAKLRAAIKIANN
ncbi:MAG: 16S rRNA (cytosine(1402)-N(4))-methyltransferase RsmH [bacterium]|nr:16S rRNA (cytosine(1402)-N(4))-methyltransferase RsmH [bacterium]